MDADRAQTLAEGARGELLALLEALIAAPSPYGSSAKEAQGRLGEYLERNDFAVETTEDSAAAQRDHPEFSPPPPAAEAPVNLVATPPDPAGLTLFAHVDTEAVVDGWTSPPCEATLRNGRVHGLGSADDKGVSRRRRWPRRFCGGTAAGRRSLSASTGREGAGHPSGPWHPCPVLARMPEAGDCLYVHPPENGAGLAILKNASRGVVDLALRVTGWSGRPREIGTPESAPYEEGGSALDACWQVVDALRQGELSDCELNLGRVVAGEAAGLTPVRCDAGLRVLFRGDRTAADVLAAVHRAAEDHARSSAGSREAFRFEVTAPGIRANPAETPGRAVSRSSSRQRSPRSPGRSRSPTPSTSRATSASRSASAGCPRSGSAPLPGTSTDPTNGWISTIWCAWSRCWCCSAGAGWNAGDGLRLRPQSRRVATRKRRRNGYPV